MKKFIFILFTGLIISCSSQTVSIDYDRNQDFSQLKDYSLEFEENSMSELDINRIQTSIQQELASKGMIINEQSSIRLKITPEEFISENQSSQVGIGVGGGNHGFGTSIGVGIPINSEKLNQRYIIRLFNAENQMVWEGRLDIQMPANANSVSIDANVQKGVSKLFKKYPPQRK